MNCVAIPEDDEELDGFGNPLNEEDDEEKRRQEEEEYFFKYILQK